MTFRLCVEALIGTLVNGASTQGAQFDSQYRLEEKEKRKDRVVGAAPMEIEAEYSKLTWPMRAVMSSISYWPGREQEEKDLGKRSSWSRLLHKCHRGVVNASMLVLTLGGSSEIVHLGRSADINDLIECCLIVSTAYLALLRVLVFATHATSMSRIVETMRNDWTDNYRDEADKALLRDRCLWYYKLASFYICSVIFAFASFTISPYMEIMLRKDDGPMFLPFRGYYFFNLSSVSRTEFNGIYLLNSMAGFFACGTIAGASSFSLIAAVHGSAKFAIVQKHFESVEWTSRQQVKRCVRHHQDCIKFADDVEDSINILVLGQFVMSTCLLCLAGFQFTTMLRDRGRCMKYLSFLQAATTNLFLYSIAAQALQTESLEVAEAIFRSKWIGSCSSYEIRMIIMRSRKACKITAGKFYELSLESFLKVLSSSFSYFTVLFTAKYDGV
ncbi:odorant receptor 13a-like [Trichogramma pretiosum]|uniref:odorant receptor 13a-like n=1 Tax=Trichogramma pretiosum TaxID=7493 RepID=UPI0006C99D86|nr:odorant receptor 13a-like [Trichogramma pretiosum]